MSCVLKDAWSWPSRGDSMGGGLEGSVAEPTPTEGKGQRARGAGSGCWELQAGAGSARASDFSPRV